MSVDPLTASYPWNSPYAYAENDPINYIDLDGAEQPTRTAQSTMRPTVPRLGNLSVGKDGRLVNNSNQLSTTGRQTSASSSRMRTRMVTQQELDAMIPPNASAYINADNQSMTIHGPNGSSRVSLLKVEKPIQITWVDRVGLRLWASTIASFNTTTQWNVSIQAYEVITNDPSTLSNEYLSQVEKRIKDGSATMQDYQYQDEIAKRKKAGRLLESSNESKTLFTKLSNSLIEKLQEKFGGGEDKFIENIKVPGGKGAGKYDLYSDDNTGDIYVKPKGQPNAPGEKTEYNLNQLNEK